MNFLQRADREIAKGRLWKARDILTTSLTHEGFRPVGYEKLGVVLLQMHDVAEAGKYFLLAGSTHPDHQEAIRVFLKEYAGRPRTLFLSFPKSAKLFKLADYPAPLAKKLHALGLPENLRDAEGHLSVFHDPPKRDFSDYLLIVFASVVLGAFLNVFLLGVVRLLEMAGLLPG